VDPDAAWPSRFWRPRWKETGVDHPAAGLSCEIPDVGDLPLSELLQLDESALGPALQRLRREADHPEEILAGWDSAV
jgi:FXSXX-COOH protein